MISKEQQKLQEIWLQNMVWVINFGTISYVTNSEQVFLGRDIGHTKHISEETASKIDSEIKSIIDNAYNIGKEILTANTEKLHNIAKVLIEREKISGEEFETIMKG